MKKMNLYCRCRDSLSKKVGRQKLGATTHYAIKLSITHSLSHSFHPELSRPLHLLIRIKPDRYRRNVIRCRYFTNKHPVFATAHGPGNFIFVPCPETKVVKPVFLSRFRQPARFIRMEMEENGIIFFTYHIFHAPFIGILSFLFIPIPQKPGVNRAFTISFSHSRTQFYSIPPNLFYSANSLWKR